MREVLVPREAKSFLVAHLSLIIHVCKVANQVNDDRWACMVANLAQPLIPDVVKACATCDVKNEEDAVTTLVEVACDGAETFLARSVPNLELHVRLLLYNHSEVAKLHTNRHSMLLFERLMCEPTEDTCFADSSVAENHDFKEDVEVIHHALEVRLVLDGDARRQVVDLRQKVSIQFIH